MTRLNCSRILYVFVLLVLIVSAAPPAALFAAPQPPQTPASAAPVESAGSVARPVRPTPPLDGAGTNTPEGAMTAAIAKYNAYWGPRASVQLGDVREERDWAAAEASARGAGPGINLLARLAPGGDWNVLLPADDDYLAWLGAAPQALLTAGERAEWRQAAGKALRPTSKPWPAIVPHPVLPRLQPTPPGSTTAQPTPIVGAERRDPGPTLTPPTAIARTPKPAGDAAPAARATPNPGKPVQEDQPAPRAADRATPTPSQRVLPLLEQWRSKPWLAATPEHAPLREQVTPRPRPRTWTAGDTWVSRLSPADFKQLLGVPADAITKTLAARPQVESAASYSYPSSVNWRNKGGYDWTTSVKNQGGCGACSAFASAAGIESRLKIAQNAPSSQPDVSESHLYYCNGGVCTNGIYIQDALKLAESAGVTTESCYPYPDSDNSCSPCSNWPNSVTKINSWTTLYDVGAIKQALAEDGPVIADMTVYEDFGSYTGGVYRHTWGKESGFHAVLLVGYDDPGGYWYAKNSWGTNWGESGWFRIGYGEGGVDDYAFVPDLGGAPLDTTDPDGDFTSPSEGVTVNGPVVHVAGWASDSGSGLNHSHFTAQVNGVWRQIGPDFTTGDFGFDWNMCDAGANDGLITLGLDIWDNAGNEANSPRGNRRITKNYNCNPAPQCDPNSQQIAIYSGAGYGGTCKVLGVGDYPNPSDLSPVGNDNTRSIKVGAEVVALLYTDAAFSGTQETFADNDDDLTNNSVGSATSSIKVQWRPAQTCSPNADQIALYASTDYSGNCVQLGTGNYPNPGYLDLVGNDNAESIKVGGNVRAYLYEHDNYGGVSSTFEVNDPSLWNDTISGNRVSSVQVVRRDVVTPPPPPTLSRPNEYETFAEGSTVDLSYSSPGATQYYGEVRGAPDGTTRTFGWTANTTSYLSLPAGSYYTYQAVARNGAGQSAWSAERHFSVDLNRPTGMSGVAQSCHDVNLTWQDHSNAEDGYYVYRNGDLVGSTAANAQSWLDPDAPEGEGVGYNVVARRGSYLSWDDYAYVNVPSCPAADTTPPTVAWQSPVGNEQTYSCSNGSIGLEAAAYDNVGVTWVYFYRWDAVNGQYRDVAWDSGAPYTAAFNCGDLNYGWNEFFATAYDAANNAAERRYIWLYHVRPGAELHPYAATGYQHPVVPASTRGGGSVNTLYSGVPTYFDLHYIDDGTEASNRDFYYELYLDGTRILRASDRDDALNSAQGLDDWAYTVGSAGWHNVRLVVDSDNNVDEGDEGNNSWQADFYWEGAGDAYEPDNSSSQARSISGLQTHSIRPAADEDWVTFGVDVSSEVRIETRGSTAADTVMRLYNASLQLVEDDDDDGEGAYSLIDRLCGSDPLGPGTYYVRINEFNSDHEISSYDVSVSRTACAPTDTEPPVVNWYSPVANTQVYNCRDETVPLEAIATDNVGVARVSFKRWDGASNSFVYLADDYNAPYQSSVACSSLNYEWNEMDAVAYDTSSNASYMNYFWLYRLPPRPDLRSYAPPGYDAPVVPASVEGTSSTGTLYAGESTYFDWHWVNGGDATATGDFTVNLYIDDVAYIQYPYSNYGAGWTGGFDDWMIAVDTPGWHTVKLVVDPGGAISESDEGNNTWEGSFYWTRRGDGWEADDTYGTSNWIDADQAHSIVPIGDADWVRFSVPDRAELHLETTGASGGDTRLWLYDSNLNLVEYSDDEGIDAYSYIERRCVDNPLPAGTYYVQVDEFGGDHEIPSYTLHFSAPTCASLDSSPPSASWLAPVSDGGVRHCFSGIVNLEAAAFDDQGVNRVSFDRWDSTSSRTVDIYTDYTAPYQATVDCASLDYEWNQVNVWAYDQVGNMSPFNHIWIYRDRPVPDIVPAQWSGWQYPIVPSSTTGTSVVDTLHAKVDTYLDWGVANAGTGTPGSHISGRLYMDNHLLSDTDFGQLDPGYSSAYLDWWLRVEAPGWHTLRVDTDAAGAISESNEGNNSWEGTFYWTDTAPLADDVEGESNWSASGLWHRTQLRAASGSYSWWYGQEATGNYDTGAANSGDLTSTEIFIPSTGYYLRFRYQYETEAAGRDWDTRFVQISADDGPFDDVVQLSDDLMNNWLNSPVIDLAPYAGRTIRVRYHFDTRDSVSNKYVGWFVDDFDISTDPPPTCEVGLEPNDAFGQASPLSIGGSASERICPGGDMDYYRFNANAGQRVILDIDARSGGSSLDSYISLYNSAGDLLAQNDDDPAGVVDSKLAYNIESNGTYYARVKAWNHPSAGGPDYTYKLKLSTDTANPPAPTINAPASDGWLDPTSQTVTVTASDDESGIERVEFWWHNGDWDNGEWIWLGADTAGYDGWSWVLNTGGQAEQTGAAVYAYAYDWGNNATGTGSWNLGIDRTPPVTTMSVLPLYDDAPFLDFYVQWTATDNLSQAAAHDVEWRQGANGAWQPLVTNTPNTAYRFLGEEGRTYYFRSRARDASGLQSDYRGGDGDVSHTVHTCPVSADGSENDDVAARGASQAADGHAVDHNFHATGDVDWTRFNAQAGVKYTLQTNNTGGDSDTVLVLHNADGSTELARNDDDNDTYPASKLVWTAPSSGLYAIKVYHWDPYAFGCTTAYQLVIAPDGPPEAITQLSVSVSGSNLYLAWPAVVRNAQGGTTTIDHYEVHRGSTPYFTPGPATLVATLAGTAYTDAGAFASAADYYYAVLAVDKEGRVSGASNRTSKIRFSLVKGS